MNYIVHNKSSSYKDVIDNIISNKKKEIFNFFNREEIDLQFNIYIYDSIEELSYILDYAPDWVYNDFVRRNDIE